MSSINKIKYNGQEYDLYGLGGDVLPIGSEIDIASDAQIPAGWEEVDDKYDIYSETEKCIGRWIDGKPLYRKVYNITNIPKSKYDYQLDIDNTCVVNTINVYYYDDNRTFCVQNPWYEFMQVYLKQNNVLRIEKNTSDSWTQNCYVILEYTKTTDTANTPITKRIKKVTQSVPPALLDDYSEEEQVIGTWIDDRPIYRKVFTVTNYTSGVDIVVNHEIENFDFAINKGGVGLRKDGKHQVISNSFNNNFDFDIFDISNVSFKYYIGSLMSGNMALTTIYLWLEYVKTTD